MNISPRPDELAQDSKTKQYSDVRTLANQAAMTVVGAAGAKLASKALPWLNELIPTDLALKGINKVYPKLGKFLQSGISAGLDPREGMDLWKNKIEEDEQESTNEPAKQSLGIIEQHSPELHKFIENEIKKGKSPLQAGVEATRGNSKFTKAIRKITQAYRMPWSAIIESVFGAGQGHTSKEEAAQKYNQRQQGGLMQQESDRFNQAYGQQQPQGGQQQGLDPAVAQILQQGAQILQSAKGRL